MTERFKTPHSVFLILLKKSGNNTFILLQKRQNTGYRDNFWDMAASGHVEKGEPATDAIIREAREEIGIKISKEDLNFSGFYYNNIDNKTYGYIFFTVQKYENTPKINEPAKCSELKWFDINNLPKDIISDRKIVIHNFLNGNYFGEVGWQ